MSSPSHRAYSSMRVRRTRNVRHEDLWTTTDLLIACCVTGIVMSLLTWFLVVTLV